MARDLNFKKTIQELGKEIQKVTYDNGDISDLGNEVGFKLGGLLKDLSEEEINAFIVGFRHGVSLTNGKH